MRKRCFCYFLKYGIESVMRQKNMEEKKAYFRTIVRCIYFSSLVFLHRNFRRTMFFLFVQLRKPNNSFENDLMSLFTPIDTALRFQYLIKKNLLWSKGSQRKISQILFQILLRQLLLIFRSVVWNIIFKLYL